MGRRPKMRVTYKRDAVYFMQLAEAVEIDARLPPSVRQGMIEKLKDLATEFLNLNVGSLVSKKSEG